MKQDEMLSGKAGLSGIQRALNGQASRRFLRNEVQEMLRVGCQAGSFRLTRAKFKPERKLSAYFTLPVLDPMSSFCQVHLAVSWQNELTDGREADHWDRLQLEADQSGLMPVQRELWREIPERGIQLLLWPFDPEFPNLVRLCNPAHARDMLASLGIAQDARQMTVVTPIRYRPGERHVLRYEVCLPGEALQERQPFYAKLYAGGEEAARAFGIANRVVDWLAANHAGVEGNRPAAMSQEDGVILYRHAAGVPLSRQLTRSSRWLAGCLRTIGRTLAVLHSGPEALRSDLRQNDFTQEARVVRRASDHVRVLLPGAYDKLLAIVAEAERRYSDLPQEEPTFTHSDFKSDHLLTTANGMTLIDFDTCTLADPALDVGKFLADLEWWFTLKGIGGLEQAHAELLKGYLQEAPGHPASGRLARAHLFHALILLKIALRRVPIYKGDWAGTTNLMIERAAQVLDGARSS